MGDLQYISRLLFTFNKSYLSIVPLIVLFLFSTLTDILSIAIIAPYISFLFNPEKDTFFQEILFKNFNHYDFNNLLVFFSLFLILIFLIKFIFALGIRFSIKKFTLGCRRDLQIRLLKSYQSMSYPNFNTRGSSDFIKNVRELSGDCITTLDASLRILSESLVFCCNYYLSNLVSFFSCNSVIIVNSNFYFNS